MLERRVGCAMTDQTQTDVRRAEAEDPPLFGRVHRLIILALQAVLAVEVALLLLRGHFFAAFMVGGVLMLPVLFRKIKIEIPVEIQLAAFLFAFATLFLGEVRDYYERYWWWDQAIHFSSGLLLGLFGFMVVYMMNQNRAVDLHMRSGFIALFAFFFAVGIGAIWELFEFAVDQSFGTNMQKPRPGDPSGLTDTMWDLAVDTAGAAIVSLYGWRWLHRGRESWLRRFVRRNPQLFGEG
jgi:hypothetical protein